LEPIKARHEGRSETRSIYTHRSQTMGRKEPEPWSPRWVRQQLKERNNGLPPNDPNHDEKPLGDTKRPLCKCDLDYQSHMSLDYDTYNRRYWSCPLPTSPFNWGWGEENLRKVDSFFTSIMPILNSVIINHFIFLKGVHVELFPPPQKLLGCDFK
jgi:hypothetical protein